MNDTAFVLERLEHLAYGRQSEAAAQELLKLLNHLEKHMGQLGPLGTMSSVHRSADQLDAHFATRIAGAVTAMFSDPAFELSLQGFHELIRLQRWMTMIFGASPFGSADHILHVLNERGYERGKEITVRDRDLLKFCLLYSLDSVIPLQPEVLWQKDKKLAAALFLALLSSRIVATDAAQAKKDGLLSWLPQRLHELSLDDFPIRILHDVWMHCSYSGAPYKHRIKQAINSLVRAKLLASGLSDIAEAPPERAKPVVLVVCEWFTSTHAVYRILSMSVEVLRSRYRVVGIALEGTTDEAACRSFDEVRHVPRSYDPLQYAKTASDLARELRPDIVYYLAVGMFPTTIFLCNLRLAPMQMASWGHSASTFSPYVDYFLVEEDLIGAPECFSEQVVALAKEALPYRPPANCPDIKPLAREAPDPVRIAVPGSVMKINTGFLDALKRIADTAGVKVEFHFFTGSAFGLGKVYMQNLIQRVLPDCAITYPHLDYAQYVENLNRCDMFVDPFPFGNCNGIVDAVRQGLVGVCWTGPELHSHIDEGLFRRLGLPEWLITRSVDEYVAAAARLARDHEQRSKLSREVLGKKPDEILFQGNRELFADSVDWLRRNHAANKASGAKVLRPPVAPPPSAHPRKAARRASKARK